MSCSQVCNSATSSRPRSPARKLGAEEAAPPALLPPSVPELDAVCGRSPAPPSSQPMVSTAGAAGSEPLLLPPPPGFCDDCCCCCNCCCLKSLNCTRPRTQPSLSSPPSVAPQRGPISASVGAATEPRCCRANGCGGCCSSAGLVAVLPAAGAPAACTAAMRSLTPSNWMPPEALVAAAAAVAAALPSKRPRAVLKPPWWIPACCRPKADSSRAGK